MNRETLFRNIIKRTRHLAIVKIDTLFPWVSITNRDDANDYFFLQGDEAEQFLSKVKQLHHKHNLTIEEAELVIASPYIEALENFNTTQNRNMELFMEER